MLRRTAEWSRLLKDLTIAFSLFSYSVAPVVGEEAQDPFGSAARKGPDPRLELEAEAKLPGVDPEMRKGAVRTDQTLLNDAPRKPATKKLDPFKEASQRAPATSQEDNPFDESPFKTTPAEDMQAELVATRAELARTKEIVGEMLQEYKQLTESRQLPPLKDAEVRVFQLKNAKADVAAQKIELLIGTQPLRVAVDERSNGLIVLGKAEAIPQVEQLIIKLDELAVAGPSGFSPTLIDRDVSAAPPIAPRRTLMLRVFWLADGVEGFDNPDDYLPFPAVQSLGKLGITHPRLVTQTVTSISVEENAGAVQFSTQVPAVLFEQPMRMILNGDLSATADNRSLVDMHLTIENGGSVCEVSGSLAAPIGHFMVLGTANSVIADHSAGEIGGGGGGIEGGMGMGMAAPVAKYNASRFAFVVQVIEAESFERSGD